MSRRAIFTMNSHFRSRSTPPSYVAGPPQIIQQEQNSYPCKQFSPTPVLCLSPSNSMTSQNFSLPPSGPLMTDQCTDECVVITCDDPDHVDGISCDSLYAELLTGEISAGSQRSNLNAFLNYTTSCSRGPPDLCTTKCSIQPVPEQRSGCGADCNTVCINPSECAECMPLINDFLEFQCCNDSYQHAAQSRQPSISPEFNVVASNSTEHYWHQTPLGSSSLSSQIPIEHASHSMYNLNGPSPHPGKTNHKESQTPMIGCQWGNCDASFSSPDELIEHVNLHHLSWGTPAQTSNEITLSRSASTISGLQTGESPTDVSTLSCHWRNCDKHPPEPEPKPHTCPLPYENWRDLIAVHIFRDHLGFPPEIASGASEITQDGREDTDSSSISADSRNSELDVLTTPTLSPALSTLTAHESIDMIRTPQQGYLDNPSDTEPSIANMTERSLCKPSKASHKCLWQGCSESFDACEDLTAHLSSVHVGSGRPVYECFWEGCTRNKEAGFGSRQKINRHLQSHTGHRPFQCSVCHQNFSEAATLQQHMRRHTQEKPYVCDHPGCNKSFAIAGALTIHKRTHSGQKPFKCPQCDRAFAESSNLSKHLRTHTGVKPYTCPEPGCVKTFARPDQLTRHLATHRKKNRSSISDRACR